MLPSPYPSTSPTGLPLLHYIDNHCATDCRRTCQSLYLYCDYYGDYDYDSGWWAWQVCFKCSKCVETEMMPSPYPSTSPTGLPSGMTSAYPSSMPSLVSSKSPSERLSTVPSSDPSASPNNKPTGFT